MFKCFTKRRSKMKAETRSKWSVCGLYFSFEARNARLDLCNNG